MPALHTFTRAVYLTIGVRGAVMKHKGAVLITCIYFLKNILLCPVLLNFRFPLCCIGSLAELGVGQLHGTAVFATFCFFAVASFARQHSLGVSDPQRRAS